MLQSSLPGTELRRVILLLEEAIQPFQRRGGSLSSSEVRILSLLQVARRELQKIENAANQEGGDSSPDKLTE
jgi:hypothetical protein